MIASAHTPIYFSFKIFNVHNNNWQKYKVNKFVKTEILSFVWPVYSIS